MYQTDSPLLIIGGNSYIGGYFADYLHRVSPRRKVILARSSDCDLLNSEETISFFSTLPNEPIEVVFFAVVNKSKENTYDALLQNQQIIQNFITAQKSVRLNSLLYVSSVDVYGNRPVLPITEASPIIPDTWYGLAKFNCESILRLKENIRCPVTVLRIPGVFGDSRNDRSVVGTFARAVEERIPIILTSQGQVYRDYVWVEDMSRLIEALLPLQFEGVMNGVTASSHSTIEVAKMVFEVLGQSTELRCEGNNEERDFDLKFDNQFLKQVLPNFCFSDLREGIRSYLRSRGSIAVAASV